MSWPTLESGWYRFSETSPTPSIKRTRGILGCLRTILSKRPGRRRQDGQARQVILNWDLRLNHGPQSQQKQ